MPPSPAPTTSAASPASAATSTTAFVPIVVSAPGKIILHGEHAVVYGHAAVAASLEMRSRIHLHPASDGDGDGDVSLSFLDVDIHRKWDCGSISQALFQRRPQREELLEGSEQFQEVISEFLHDSEKGLQKTSLTCFFYLYATIFDEPLPVQIKVESDIPIGGGLGSSAALSVCLAAGLLKVRDGSKELDYEEINRLAHISEKVIHGPRASGLDNYISTYGGVVVYSKGKMERIQKSPSIKVARQLDESPDIIKPILSAMGEISNKCVEILREMGEAPGGGQREHYDQLEELIDRNQKLLEAVKVSHPALERIVAIAEEHGLHAKLTGAGGGGFAYVLLPPHVNVGAVKRAKERLKEGFSVTEVVLGDPGGVKVEDGGGRDCTQS